MNDFLQETPGINIYEEIKAKPEEPGFTSMKFISNLLTH